MPDRTRTLLLATIVLLIALAAGAGILWATDAPEDPPEQSCSYDGTVCEDVDDGSG